MKPKLIAASVACMCFACAALAADKLNVKVGLWEIQTETTLSGMPPIPKDVLDKLTPEQRGAVEEGMKLEASNGPQREVSKECITAADLADPFGGKDSKDCTHTVVATTRTTQEVRVVCNGNPKGSGFFRVVTPTPESMQGDLEINMTDGTNKMNIKAKVTGKWLGADCGGADEG